ncbi:hypothetical protein [Deinococcus ruber]|uniref:Uncharacterized protein n=1 Tax=Deinococcus ruber TaxID=1848197 RepID=A0A918CMG3_9DEIO|nr:hypothetical protein [Deinococcus ruber]GGR31828.1 hypothetical protein GCM10008957_48070 [Deinococcus ruber]
MSTIPRPGALLSLIRETTTHPARTLAEAVVPGETLWDQVNAFADLLLTRLPCSDELLLSAEPGIYLQAFDVIFNGATCVRLLPGETTQSFRLCHEWRLG